AEAEAKAKAEAEAMEAAAEDSLVMPAAVSYCGHYKVVTKDIDSGLYQRQGPSMDDSIIAFLKNGTVVPVYAWSGEWAYISYNNKNGWVNSRYLTKN
ncbi:MAG: SH3 domain-containing protein, partial [Acutalibacteraceae bacterium]